MNVILEGDGKGSWTVRKLDAAGKVVEEVTGARAVADLCHDLGRSRRQVYRYLKDGWLVPVGKFLGEWLVDPRGAEYLSLGRPRPPRPLPGSARALFPEYRLEQLHALRDAPLVIQRLLELGSREEIAWLFRQYSVAALRSWVTRHGWRLTPRSANFWGLRFGTTISLSRPGFPSVGRA